jgi:hypothetical protein
VNAWGKKCGMNDLVILHADSVTDAIFRSPDRHYTGKSSSPEAIPPRVAAREKPAVAEPMKVRADSSPKAPKRMKPAPANDPTLVAHWKFDDANGAAAVDSSGGGLNGSLRNGPAWTTGRIGGALSFNGTTQYVDVGSSPKLYFKGPFTLALWVNPSDVGNDKYHYLLGDYTAKGDQSSMALRIFKTGHAQFFWEYPPGVWSVAQSKTIPTVSKWVHLAGTWDGAMRRIYVNGALEGVDGTPQQRPPTMHSLSIGRCEAFDVLYTAGDIDDVRIYSRALTDGEIQALVRSASRK